ncbi:hypothetical protein COV20_02185 [Candidatus Woesearchaeota archaeon CG10_big_fil_rev_8_21_14_0_10_45_16]|nr:MAG: hypothetical protein COV20_02185 [Candidatus Woesearchaeota archaeon CG10_big_fil_rev_8_21_14_0_10_45_16]
MLGEGENMKLHKGVPFFIAILLVLITAQAALADVVINEIMQNPSASPESMGEYIELYNTDPNNAVDIDGWTVKDNGSDSHIINNGAPLLVPANGFIVLCRNSNNLTNGGFNCDYEYAGITLGNADDEVILLDNSSLEVDRVEYNDGLTFPDPSDGISMELINPALDNNLGSSWREATIQFGAGDFGTPGAANNAPPTSADNTITTDEDSEYAFSAADFNFSDPDGDNFSTFIITDLPARGDLTFTGGVLREGVRYDAAGLQDGSLAYMPGRDQNGAAYDSFKFKVRDGQFDSEIYTMTINVNPINDLPTLRIDDVYVDEDSGSYSVDLRDHSGDIEDRTNNLQYSIISELDETAVDCSLDNGHTLVCETQLNQIGKNLVLLNVTDRDGGSNYDDFKIIVNPVNDQPTINLNDLSVDEDSGLTAIDLDPFIADVEDAAADLRVRLQSQSDLSAVSCRISGHDLECATVPDRSGSNTLEIVVSDTEGLSATGSFILTVNEINDLPNFDVPDQMVGEDSGALSLDLTNFVSDVEDDTTDLTFSLDDQSNPSVVSCSLSVTILECEPLANQSGDSLITLTVTDSNDGRTQDTFTITVNNDNDAPAITSTPPADAIRGRTYTYDVIAEDPDGDDVSVSISQSTINGQRFIDVNYVSVRDNRVSIIPQNTGVSRVSIVVSDGNGGRNTQAYDLNVASTLEVSNVQVARKGEQLSSYGRNSTTTSFQPGDTLQFQVTLHNQFTDDDHPLIRQDVEPIIEQIVMNVPQIPSELGIPLRFNRGQDGELLFLGPSEEKSVQFDYTIPLSWNDGNHLIQFFVNGADRDVPQHFYGDVFDIKVDVQREPHSILITSATFNDEDFSCLAKQNNVRMHLTATNIGLEQNENLVAKVFLGEELLRKEEFRMNANMIDVPVSVPLDLHDLTGEHTLRVEISDSDVPGSAPFDMAEVTVDMENCAPQVDDSLSSQVFQFDEDTTSQINLAGMVLDVEDSQTLSLRVENDNANVNVVVSDDAVTITPIRDYFTPAGETDTFTLIAEDGTAATRVEVRYVIKQLADDGVQISSRTPGPDDEIVLNQNKDEDTTFSVDVTNDDAIPITYIWTLRNTAGGSAENLNVNIDKFDLDSTSVNAGRYEVKASITYFNAQGQLQTVSESWTVIVVDRPIGFDDFPGSSTTDIAAEANINNVELVLENANGKIEWLQGLDLSQIGDISQHVTITSNSVAVDTENAPKLAGKARITLNKKFSDPAILTSEGFNHGSFLLCENCVIENSDPLTFTVESFSTYKVEERKNAAFSTSDIFFDDVAPGETGITIVTVQNTGSLDTISNITYKVAETGYGILLPENLPTELAPGEKIAFELEATVPEDEEDGKHEIGVLKLAGTAKGASLEWGQAIYLKPKSFIIIESFEINGKSSNDLSIEESNEIEVEIRNNLDIDLNDVEVTITLLDVDGDDLDEDAEDQDIDAGDKEKFKVEFDLGNEEIDEEEYTFLVEVEGEDDNDVIHKTSEEFTVKIDLENHNLVIDRAVLSPNSLQCTANTRLDVTVKNLGRSDEDDVVVRVSNAALGLDLSRDEIEIDEFTASNNEEDETFNFNIGDAKSGSYPIEVEVLRGSKKEDSQTITLTVSDCGVSQSVGQQQQLGLDNYAQRFQNELSRQVMARQQYNQPLRETSVRASFRDSTTYLFVLGGLLFLGLVAFILSIAVMTSRKGRRRAKR